MKITIVFPIILTSLCTVAFAAESFQVCNEKLEATMKFCFQSWLRNSRKNKNLRDLRNSCMKDVYCKFRAKNCLLSAFKTQTFTNCPLVQTYIKSVNRMFK
ncbi:hypothetical protein EWB00_005926 [Schistosoma japonicum]|uniref:Uncharacterized protein n=1 Tax=Schistosoma japonicum TaxID=6182 RepID=C1L4N4_SCHJA|nr:hypothetical protein KSF78_0001369 [Schistosoma japonicum]TNN09830.1 hypothetical protein EWB00_005926 [Schistosoma japonicum]CAX69662.1 hypothetical protein [Schistosoma japonicum]